MLGKRSRSPRWRTTSLVLCAGVACVLAFAAVATGSCTTFDGVSASGPVVVQPDAPDAPDAPVLPSYLSVADAARVCSRVINCQYLPTDVLNAITVPLDKLNFSLCMHWAAGPVPANRVGFTFQQQVLQCVAAASTCEQAEACFPLENLAPNDPRCWQPEGGLPEGGVCPDAGDGGDAGCTIEAGPTGIPDKCADDGGTVLKCDGLYKYALHCNTAYFAPGSYCVADVDDTRWCALGTNCNVYTSCLGLTLDYCGGPDSFVHESVNCTFTGRTCGVDPDSGATDCLAGDSIKKCTSAGADCRGDIVAVCDGIVQSEFDCAAIHGTCSKQQGAARCVRSSDSCTPFDQTMNTCTGNLISVCIGGEATSFDCTQIGMTCKPGVGAQSGHCG